jgi:hypothetical protein
MSGSNDATCRAPIGLQRLLRLAAVDPAFLDELVLRRSTVADAAGITLSPAERAILAAIPAAQLRDLAGKLPPLEPPRRDGLRLTAATAVVLLGGAALAGCPPGDGRQEERAEAPPPPPAVELSELGGQGELPQLVADPPPIRAVTLPAIGGVLADMPEECE